MFSSLRRLLVTSINKQMVPKITRVYSGTHVVVPIESGLKYNPQQIEKILSVVNKATVSELLNLNMTKDRAANIVKYREKYGEYREIERILQAEGILEPNLKKLCDKIVGPKKKSTEQKILVVPKISEDLKQTLSSVTALGLSKTHLSWSRVDRNSLSVTDWQQIRIIEDYKLQPPHAVFEIITTAVRQMPKADAYVLERPPTQSKHLSALPALLRLTALYATLVAVLNDQFLVTNEHKVFSVKPAVLTNHFNIGIGNERVSCSKLISRILNCGELDGEELQTQNEILSQVSMPKELSESYLQEKLETQEELGTTLLLALGFYELVVFNSGTGNKKC